MKKRTVVLYIAALVLAIAVWACLMPGSRKIDTVVLATEYSFADPDYRVERTVTIQGYDTRNILGKGKFEGTFAAPGWTNAGDGWHTVAPFPMPEHYINVWNIMPESSAPNDLASLLPSRDWTAFVCLLQESWVDANGDGHASLDPETCRFLVSGALSRDEALALAADLTRDTPLEVVFANR